MCAAFVRRYLYLPETKGKSLEEMLRYFQEITKESVTGKGGEAVGGLLSDRGTCAVQTQSRVVVLCSSERLWLLLLFCRCWYWCWCLADAAVAVEDSAAGLGDATNAAANTVDGLQDNVARPIVSPKGDQSDDVGQSKAEKSALI